MELCVSVLGTGESCMLEVAEEDTTDGLGDLVTAAFSRYCPRDVVLVGMSDAPAGSRLADLPLQDGSTVSVDLGAPRHHDVGGEISALCLAPGEKPLIAFGGRHRVGVVLCTAHSGTILWRAAGFWNTGTISCLAFSTGSTRLAAAKGSRTAVFDAATGTPLAMLASPDLVSSAAFSKTGGMVLSASGAAVSVWSTSSQSCRCTLRGHSDIVSQVCTAWSRYITCSWDETIRLWSHAGDCLHVLSGHIGAVNDISLSACGARLASAGDDGTARLWNLQGCGGVETEGEGGVPVCLLVVQVGQGSLRHVHLSGRGGFVLCRRAATPGAADATTVWDAETGVRLASGGCLDSPCGGGGAAPQSLAVTGCGRYLLEPRGIRVVSVPIWDNDKDKANDTEDTLHRSFHSLDPRPPPKAGRRGGGGDAG